MPSTGVLLDTSRPGRIVSDILERASGAISFPDEATHEEALTREFAAYWPTADDRILYSLLPPEAESAEIALVRAVGMEAPSPLITTDESQARRWLDEIGVDIHTVESAYHVRLQALPVPFRFCESMTVRDIMKMAEGKGSPQAREGLRSWLLSHGLPATVVLSAPHDGGNSVVRFAAEIVARKKQYAGGFSPKTVPPTRQVSEEMSSSVARLEVRRMDPEHLLERGGGRRELLHKRVVVIGCGSVGSYTALSLASSGVGTILLIDKERLSIDNVYRHALGMSAVGKHKADALAAVIRRRFPLIEVKADPEDVLDAIDPPSQEILDNDVMIVAVGDPNLELELNSILKRRVPRVHVWLEAFGVGGHTLTTGLGVECGCYNCLFSHHHQHGLKNNADLLAPGHDYTRSMAGCSATFTPYGCIDAQRAAIEATRATLNVLIGKVSEPILFTWTTDQDAAPEHKDFLSERGRNLLLKRSETKRDFGRRDCTAC